MAMACRHRRTFRRVRFRYVQLVNYIINMLYESTGVYDTPGSVLFWCARTFQAAATATATSLTKILKSVGLIQHKLSSTSCPAQVDGPPM